MSEVIPFPKEKSSQALPISMRIRTCENALTADELLAAAEQVRDQMRVLTELLEIVHLRMAAG